MGTKESNKVRMIGILPSQGAGPIPVGKIPDDGIQKIPYSSEKNSSGVVYTVPALTTFYLSSLAITGANTSGAARDVYVAWRNAADTIQGYFFFLDDVKDCVWCHNQTFIPPFELPEGYDIFVLSSGADARITLLAHGYEI